MLRFGGEQLDDDTLDVIFEEAGSAPGPNGGPAPGSNGGPAPDGRGEVSSPSDLPQEGDQ